MKKNIPITIIIILTASLLNACGASSAAAKPSNSSVAKQKGDRAGNTALRRVDQHTDLKINNAIDRLFRKL